MPDVGQHKNDATTFKPYNPADTIGDTSPALPYIEKPAGLSCTQAIGMIVATIVRVVTQVVGSILVQTGTLAWLGVAIGALGEVVAQGVEMAVGLREEFSWGAVAAAALSTFVMGKLGPVADGVKGATSISVALKAGLASEAVMSLPRAMGAAAINYGASYVFSKLAGEDAHFSWKGLAASVATAAISNKLGKLGKSGTEAGSVISRSIQQTSFSWAKVAQETLRNLGVSVINKGVTQLITGEKQDWNPLAMTADAFGNVLASSALSKVHGWAFENAPAASAPPPEASMPTTTPRGMIGSSSMGLNPYRYSALPDEDFFGTTTPINPVASDRDTKLMDAITVQGYLDPDGTFGFLYWGQAQNRWGGDAIFDIGSGHFTVGAMPPVRYNPAKQGVSPLPRGYSGGEIPQPSWGRSASTYIGGLFTDAKDIAAAGTLIIAAKPVGAGAEVYKYFGGDVNPGQIVDDMFGAAHSNINSPGHTPFKLFQVAGMGMTLGGGQSIGNGVIGLKDLAVHVALSMPAELTILSSKITGQSLDDLPFGIGGLYTNIHNDNATLYNTVTHPIESYWAGGRAGKEYLGDTYNSFVTMLTSNDADTVLSAGITTGDHVTTVGTILYGGGGAVKTLSNFSRAERVGAAVNVETSVAGSYADAMANYSQGTGPIRTGPVIIPMEPELPALANPSTRLPRSDGSWVGKPGDGAWYSTKPDVIKVTGGKPVQFSNGRADFTPWSRGQITFEEGILDGTDADFKAVYKYVQQQKGLSSPTAAKNYLREMDLTPHHLDNTTIQLIPTPLHGNIPHIGSASDLRGGY